MTAKFARSFVLSQVPQARYLNLSGTHCIDDHDNDRYLAYRANSRVAAWRIAAKFLMDAQSVAASDTGKQVSDGK
jgi:hypothetical protein